MGLSPDFPKAIDDSNWLGECQIASVSSETDSYLDKRIKKLIPGVSIYPVVQCSATPPAWVQLLLPYAVWATVLKGVWNCTGKPFFTKFFEGLGDCSGKDCYAAIKGLHKASKGQGGEGVEPIAELFDKAQQMEGRSISLRLAVPDGDNPNGCVFVAAGPTVDDLKDQFVMFAAMAPGVKIALRNLRDSGADPVGFFMWEPASFGFILRWYNRKTSEEKTVSFQFDGKVKG